MNKKKTTQTTSKTKQGVRLFTSTAKKTSPPRKHNNDSRLFENKRYRFQQKISKTNLLPGMIVMCKYSGKSVHDRNPMILVLNKNYLGKLHGINLNYCTYKEIIEIGKVVNERIHPSKIKLKQKYRMTSPYGFYHTQLKPMLKGLGKSIYRTYFYKTIKDPKLLDYKFEATKGKNYMIFNSNDGSVITKISKLPPEKIKRAAIRRPQKVISVNNSNAKTISSPLVSKALSATGGSKQIQKIKSVSTKTVPNVKSVSTKKSRQE